MFKLLFSLHQSSAQEPVVASVSPTLSILAYLFPGAPNSILCFSFQSSHLFLRHNYYTFNLFIAYYQLQSF